MSCSARCEPPFARKLGLLWGDELEALPPGWDVLLCSPRCSPCGPPRDSQPSQLAFCKHLHHVKQSACQAEQSALLLRAASRLRIPDIIAGDGSMTATLGQSVYNMHRMLYKDVR